MMNCKGSELFASAPPEKYKPSERMVFLVMAKPIAVSFVRNLCYYLRSMETKNIYQVPIMLTFGGYVKLSPRGILSISEKGRVKIVLQDGTTYLSAPAKQCKLSYSPGNAWFIKIDGHSFAFITLTSMVENPKFHFSRYGLSYWMHEDGNQIQPDKVMESFFRNADQFPEDQTPIVVQKDYEPVPGFKRTAYITFSLVGLWLVIAIVSAVQGASSQARNAQVKSFLFMVGLAVIFTLIVLKLRHNLETAMAQKNAKQK